MKNIFIITKREFLVQIRKKSFIIMTFFSPFLLFLLATLVTFLFKNNTNQTRVQVVDYSNLFITNFKSSSDILYELNFLDDINILNQKIKLQKIDSDAIIVIPESRDKNLSFLEKNIVLYYKKSIPKSNIINIKNKISDRIKQIRLQNLGINQEQYLQTNSNIKIKEININDYSESINNELNQQVKEVLAFILMYCIFMFTIIYGTRIMRNILEEKNNRVIEIIISSVKPFDLMIGKILGTSFVAFSQFSFWILLALVTTFFLNNSLEINHLESFKNQIGEFSNQDLSYIKEITSSMLSIDYKTIIFVFLFYFFFGYLFFSSIFAAIGSSVDSETETAQFTPIVIVPLSLAVYGSFSIINNPDGNLAFWLSIFPVTSPISMVTRIPFGVPFWQLLLSMLILILSTFLTIFIASKIYKTGILMYGKKITIKELYKWLKYK